MNSFDGATYEPGYDLARLTGQLNRVHTLMCDGRWRTLSALTHLVGGSEAGVSARLRDLRKPRFGSHTIERERLNGGLFRYRMRCHTPAVILPLETPS
jgi:hypothetical protein